MSACKIKIINAVLLLFLLLFPIFACSPATPSDDFMQITPDLISPPNIPLQQPTLTKPDTPSQVYKLLINLRDHSSQSLFKLDPVKKFTTPVLLPDNLIIKSLKHQISPDRSLIVLEKYFNSTLRNLLVYDFAKNQSLLQLDFDDNNQVNFQNFFLNLPLENQESLTSYHLGAWALEEGYLISRGKFWWCNHPQRLFYSHGSEMGNTHLFVFNPQDGNIVQVEDLPGMVQSLQCSPTGGALLLTKSITPYYPHPVFETNYVIKTDGSIIEVFLPPIEKVLSWTMRWANDNSLWLLPDSDDDLNYLALYRFNIDTSSFESIWDQDFVDFSQSNDNYVFLSSAGEHQSEMTITGPHTQLVIPVPDKCFEIQASGVDTLDWTVRCEHGWFGVNQVDQQAKEIDPPGIKLLSPDSQWAISYPRDNLTDEQNTLTLLDKDGKKTNAWTTPPIKQVLWEPDSQYIVIITAMEIYRLNIPAGSLELILADGQDDYHNLDVIWIDW